jgi:hypothetical protein
MQPERYHVHHGWCKCCMSLMGLGCVKTQIGKLVVLEPLSRSLYPAAKERKYRCPCDCGNLHPRWSWDPGYIRGYRGVEALRIETARFTGSSVSFAVFVVRLVLGCI